MKFSVLLLAFLSSSSALAFDKALFAKYEEAIKKLEASCETLKPFKTPSNAYEQFCSPSPVNQISVRYCVYQNMLNPDNKQSISFEHLEMRLSANKTTKITVTMECSNIKI